jgi:hypothetical protein
MAVKRSGVNAGRSAFLWRMIRLLGQNADLRATRLKSANVFSLMIDGQRLLASIPMSFQGLGLPSRMR